MNERVIINCPKCDKQLRIPIGKSGKVCCPVCRNFFYSDTRREQRFYTKQSMLNQLPIIGGITESIRLYVLLTWQILKENRRFIVYVINSDEDKYAESIKYFEVGVVVGFIYLVPFLVMHNQSLSKFLFVAQQLISILFYVYCINFSLKLFKGKNVLFRKTMTIMSYLWGLIFPLNFLFSTPLLIEIGPSFFSEGYNTDWVNSVSRDTLRLFNFIGAFGGILLISLWLFLILPWLSNCYGISKKRVLFALLLGGLPAGLVSGLLLGPLFKFFESVLVGWLMAL